MLMGWMQDAKQGKSQGSLRAGGLGTPKKGLPLIDTGSPLSETGLQGKEILELDVGPSN